MKAKGLYGKGSDETETRWRLDLKVNEQEHVLWDTVGRIEREIVGEEASGKEGSSS